MTYALSLRQKTVDRVYISKADITWNYQVKQKESKKVNSRLIKQMSRKQWRVSREYLIDSNVKSNAKVYGVFLTMQSIMLPMATGLVTWMEQSKKNIHIWN